MGEQIGIAPFISPIPLKFDIRLYRIVSIFSSCGAVAQLGEHKAGSLGVRGSIPLSSTKRNRTGEILAQPSRIDGTGKEKR